MKIALKKKEPKKFRPFHYTVVDALRRCVSLRSNVGKILDLFEIIRETEILANHGNILAEIDELFTFYPGNARWAKEIFLVKDSIREQAKKAQEKSRAWNEERKNRPQICR